MAFIDELINSEINKNKKIEHVVSDYQAFKNKIESDIENFRKIIKESLEIIQNLESSISNLDTRVQNLEYPSDGPVEEGEKYDVDFQGGEDEVLDVNISEEQYAEYQKLKREKEDYVKALELSFEDCGCDNCEKKIDLEGDSEGDSEVSAGIPPEGSSYETTTEELLPIYENDGEGFVKITGYYKKYID